MNTANLADPAYVKDQYRESTNLGARIALHERFSTATRDWFDWYFDHLDLPNDARVLEIGCGTGLLWFDFDSNLEVTEVEPLVAYAMSGFVGEQLIGTKREDALRQFIADRIARDGAFHITKAVGLFVARAD